MPYGFYELVRFSALLGFVILAYQANKDDKQIEMIIYAAFALEIPVKLTTLNRSKLTT